jgi:hypothetical protein
MSISTSLQDRIENLMLQHFKPYAFTVTGSIVYVTKLNVGYVEDLLSKHFHQKIKVIGKGTDYVFQSGN